MVLTVDGIWHERVNMSDVSLYNSVLVDWA